MFIYTGRSVSNNHLGSSADLCYIPNLVISNRVIKKLRCNINIFFRKKTTATSCKAKLLFKPRHEKT